MRVLVAIAPQMYRQAVVLTLRNHRPSVEVEACDPEDLERNLARFLPRLLVCHHTAPDVRERVAYRVEILYEDSLDAAVVTDGRVTRVADIDIDRLLAVLDEAAEAAPPG